MNQTFIIFGSHGYNTLGTIHCMAERGIEFFLLLVEGSRLSNVTLYSRYVKHHKSVNNETEGVSWLLNSAEALCGSVIYPTSDKAESLLDIHYDSLKGYYHFPHANAQGEVNRLMKKDIQLDLALKAGLYTPTVFNNIGEVQFPCLIKAKKSIEGSKKEMKICRNTMELTEALANSKLTKDFLIQQYIEKEYDLLLLGCRLPTGDIIIPGVFKKERWYMKGEDGSFGIISTQVSNYFNQIDEAKRFIRSLNYIGPFSLEFGVKNGKAYFYEINLRNDGTSHYFHKTGIYIPYWFYNACTNKLGQLPPIFKKEYYFIDELGDIINIFSTKLSFSQWIKDLKKAQSYKYYIAHDKSPFYHLILKQSLLICYKIFKVLQSRYWRT